jgi:hypothetical protein
MHFPAKGNSPWQEFDAHFQKPYISGFFLRVGDGDLIA